MRQRRRLSRRCSHLHCWPQFCRPSGRCWRSSTAGVPPISQAAPGSSAGCLVHRCGRRRPRRGSRLACSLPPLMLGGMATELKPAYLLYGSDKPKIARAVRRLRERMGDDATEHLTARESSGADAVAACNSLGLFVGEGRLVIVDDAERWKAADVKDVVAYLGSPAPATVLALVAEEIK